MARALALIAAALFAVCGNAAFSNLGKPLAPLGSVMEEEIAYVLAGSFVEFLVERYTWRGSLK